jgi:hypothetical protein
MEFTDLIKSKRVELVPDYLGKILSKGEYSISGQTKSHIIVNLKIKVIKSKPLIFEVITKTVKLKEDV